MKRVVVTGLGAISPIGNDAKTMWEAMISGTNGISEITQFPTDEYKVKLAAEVKNFDPVERLGGSEYKRYDRFVQFALSAADEAVLDSGILGSVDEERLGVYIGSGVGGINTTFNETKKLLQKGSRWVSPFLVPMMIGNMASGLVAIRYKAKGPNLPVVTACATATHAIGEAFRAIRYGYADAIIAGGSEAAINEISVAGFTSCMALTHSEDPKRASIPFDLERSGFVMGEGSGLLILEEYEHAVSRGAHIYAEVTGYGNTCDAHHMTAPDPAALGGARAITLAIKESELEDFKTVYLNAHGTSTSLNDKCETLAIKTAFGSSAYDRVLISSTKSMTGHMLGAAGGVEAIAAIMALSSEWIPPTIGYSVADPECDLDCVPNKARNVSTDASLSLSLGFGGHNACLVFRKI
ncbi:MAG: beta-ketoacyl-[acyl-carrier-protein] synthase II [Clostridia bacterium]|nr:beta-ketoacyl-[acyl-carrier-protein] synthase II [Clostridia bacterium]